MTNFRALWLASLLACTAPSLAQAADMVSPALKLAIADPARDPDDIKRDGVMKPADVLSFARIKSGQIVAELAPGQGYYSRILSRLLGPKGALYMVVPFTGAINADTLRKQANGAALPIDDAHAVKDIAGYENMLVIWEDLALDGGQFALPKQVDAVWMSADYRNLHNKAYGAAVDSTAVTKAIFASINAGGSYTVSDIKDASETPDTVKQEIMGAGFVLDAETMIGDRFVLRFKKPANASGDNRGAGMAAVKTLYGNTLVTGMGREIERHLFYHPDGTYQELGKAASLLQEGYWYIDAAGRNCILHQYPRGERGYTFCMMFVPRKPNEHWTQVGRRGPENEMLAPGFVYMDGTTVTPMKP